MAETKTYEVSDFDKAGFTKNVKIFICYDLQPTANRDELISSITEGAKHATQQLPFLAGIFKFEESGKLSIVTTPASQLAVNVRTFDESEHKSFSSLVRSSFASDDIKYSQIFDEQAEGKNTVCSLQLNLIEGGLILAFQMNHAAGDWTSINTALSLICQSTKAHRAGLELPTYTPDLNRGPFNAHVLDPPMSREQLLKSLPIFKVLKKSEFKMPPPPPPSPTKLYRITEQDTKQLKEQCAPFLGSYGLEYVTSYDCISALAWRAVTRARLQLQPQKISSSTRFVHPIDVRNRDPEKKTSEKYFGNAVIGCQAGPVDVQELVADGDEGLALAASLIRKSISTVSLFTIGHMTHLMQSLSATEMLGGTSDFTYGDLFVNSWYSAKAEQYDLGDGTNPVAFRKDPRIAASSVVLLPDFSKGGPRTFDILVQLTAEEHGFLKEDEEFLKYFEFVS